MTHFTLTVNLNTLKELKKIGIDCNIDFHVLGTRALEGSFGERRIYAKRTCPNDYESSLSSYRVKFLTHQVGNFQYNYQTDEKYKTSTGYLQGETNSKKLSEKNLQLSSKKRKKGLLKPR